MNLDDLRAFVQVAEAGGFSRAALVHRVAQSALSKRVTRLEADLGLRLVARDGRGIRPTEQGLLLLHRAAAIFGEIETAIRDLHDSTENPRGRVVLGLPPTTAGILAPLVARDIATRHPGIELAIREGVSGSLNDWLIEGTVDLAILYDPGEAAETRVTPLIREPVHLVISPALRRRFPGILDQGVVPLADIAALPLILPSRNHAIRQLVERHMAAHRVALTVACEVDGTASLRAMVAAGLGCTVMSYAGVHAEVDRQVLALVPTHPRLDWMLGLAERAPEQRSRAVAAVRRSILDHAPALRRGGYWGGEFLFR